MSRPKNYDFSGWATKFGIKCSDGRTIMDGAFNDNDGTTVPLVYNHNHDDLHSVVGHMYLEHRGNGMYGYGIFNHTEDGEAAKELVKNGDIRSLSIYANRLTQDNNRNVSHGMIREVSLVLAGANPGAFIDNVIAHGDNGDPYENEEEAYITCGEGDGLELGHSDSDDEIQNEDNDNNKENNMKVKKSEDNTEELEHSEKAEENKADDKTADDGSYKFSDEFMKQIDGKTVDEVIESFGLDKDQVNFIYSALGSAYQKGTEENQNKEDNPDMKHNVFDNEETDEEYIVHSDDQKSIVSLAKNPSVGTLRNALSMYEQEHSDELAHAASNPFEDVDKLFPEYKDVSNGNPEVLRNKIGWVTAVLNGVHSTRFPRIKTKQIDERLAELRANGYIKGDEKAKQAARKILSRTTDPQTIYVNNQMDRDEVADIEDFDAIAYLKAEDALHLREEIARAILIGDGREEGDAHKIEEDHIRPIWTDNELYAIHQLIDVEAAKKKLQGTDTSKYFGSDFVNAHALVDALYSARKNYRGTGKPTMFCSEEVYSWFALATDRTGHDAYDTEDKIKTKLQVSDIETVYSFDNLVRTTADGKKHKLVAIFVNLDDYMVGANKNGQLTTFDDFDIDFNKMKTLTETRLSGALRSPLTAMVIEEEVTDAAAASDNTGK